MENQLTLLRTTALLYLFTGLPYALGSTWLTGSLIRKRSLVTIAGITFYQGSFIHRLGFNYVIAASITFILVGIGFVLTAAWLWRGLRIGGVAALVLFPFIMAITIGGEAPILLFLEPLKVILVLLAWGSLR
jgi:hypothetical protein